MGRTILFPTDESTTAKAADQIAANIARGEGDSIVVSADRVLRRASVPVVLAPL